jgi:hypothetical protein
MAPFKLKLSAVLVVLELGTIGVLLGTAWQKAAWERYIVLDDCRGAL